MEPEFFPLKIFFSCSLGGGGRYLSVPCRSIQIEYRQTFILRAINSSYRYRIALPEELISVAETDLW